MHVQIQCTIFYQLHTEHTRIHTMIIHDCSESLTQFTLVTVKPTNPELWVAGNIVTIIIDITGLSPLEFCTKH